MIPDEIGTIPSSTEEKQNLLDADYLPCRNMRCDLMVSPETQNKAWAEHGEQAGFTCPRCTMGYGFNDPTPFGNGQAAQLSFMPGGGTIAGINMNEQGDIGETLVHELKAIPGYGPITWTPDTYKSPLDGRTADWGLEIKTICIDAKNHRFIAGEPKEKADKNVMAAKMGLKGILGLLVILDYRRSVADIYAREMPLDLAKVNDPDTVHLAGIKHFRSQQAGVEKLVTEIPFKNPLLDPSNPQPEEYSKSNDAIPF